MSENKPLILIVEDDCEMARLTDRLLKRQGYDVLVASTAADAREIAIASSPDLYVLDINLPDGDGLSLCVEFRERTDAPVLFLTGKSGTRDKVSGLSSGGDYYLTKPYDKDELTAVVQTLLRRSVRTREKIAEASIITKGALTLKIDERKAFVGERDAELSQKEFAVLLLLVQNEGKELTYEYIYESIWSSAMNNNSNALRQQISRIKKKLHKENEEGFSIFNEHGKGYTFVVNK